MTRVKICGIRAPDHALLAAEAGADFIGLIFYPPSHRYVTLAEARAVRAALDTLAAPPYLVGVFVNTPLAEICAVADACGLDLIQLSGDEPRAMLAELPRPAIKAERLRSEGDVDRVLVSYRRPNPLAPFPKGKGELDANVVSEREGPSSSKSQTRAPHRQPFPIEKGPGASSLPQPLLLLDTPDPGAYGGTGRTADWTLARRAAAALPLFLSGGLTPENVAEAIACVRPWGVDVSSGVETDRVKDPAKIRAFVRAAKEGARTD